MTRRLLGTLAALVPVLFGTLWSVAADAQEPAIPPPIRPAVDGNGVELVSGVLQLDRTDIAIGLPGAGGLTYGGIFPVGPSTRRYTGTVTTVNQGNKVLYTVAIDSYAERFEKPNGSSTITSLEGKSSTLTENASSFTYRSENGLVAVFSKNQAASTLAPAHITSLTLPEGEVRTYHYVTVPYCGNVGCTSTTPRTRLQSVTNNRGYQIKLLYQFNGTPIPMGVEYLNDFFRIVGAIGINMAVDYCSPSATACTGLTQTWPRVTYDYGAFSLAVLDVTGATSSDYMYQAPVGGSPSLSVRLRGSATYDLVYTFEPQSSFLVKSVNRNGRMWNYSYSSTSTDLTTVVTDPQSRPSTYVFDATTRSIKSYTNTAGEVTTYQNDTKGRPSIITLPTGETVRYQYDTRGNVTELRRTSYPSGSPDLVWTAGYDASCSTSTAKKCNKPNWTRNPAGSQTDYVYATTHGNPTAITLPAKPNGIRPAVNYTYTAYQAYYKNASGSIVAAGTNIYYLTRAAECRTAASCSDTSADQLRTDIGYGANNVANNRLPVQATVRNGSGTLIATTNIEYDAVGNAVAVDGPLAGTVDRVVTRYDALRRVIGTVGPDPDGAGPRLHIGARITYNSRGLPEVEETGNLPGQAGSAWASFVPSQAVVRQFDIDRRVTKTSLVAGGSTYAVEQVSFDTLGRVDCSVTRMNPAYFGALPSSACTATGDEPFGPDRIVKFGYGAADRVTSMVSGYGRPDAITEQMTYLPGGRLATLSDGKGNKTTYSYDGYGRLQRINYPHPSNVGQSSSTDYEEFAYNVNSQVVSTRRRSGHVIDTPRDALGRVTVQDLPLSSAEDVYFAYDNQGRLLSALYNSPSGDGITQTYDGLGRMQTRTVFGRPLSYQYDIAGRRTRLTYPDEFYVTSTYTNLGELQSLTDSAGTVLATFGYDELGARTSLSRPNGAITIFVPDAVKRLQQLTQDVAGTSFDLTTTFGYNPVSQIASKTSSNETAYTWLPPVPNSTVTAQFDGQNQLTHFAGTSVTDDVDGNLRTGLNNLTYTFDLIGQLRGATGGSSAVSVDYDPSGMLRRVTEGSTVTEYLYDGPDLVAQYNDSGIVVHRFVHGPGLDEPLVVYEGPGTGNKSWLHADERGSIIAASNASGVATASVKYSSDGESGTLVSPFGYTGQLYLPALQLYYYKARMYSPKAGRFLQPDPIGYADGMNLYSYVGNDPINSRDPFGLQDDLQDLREYILSRTYNQASGAYMAVPWMDMVTPCAWPCQGYAVLDTIQAAAAEQGRALIPDDRVVPAFTRGFRGEGRSLFDGDAPFAEVLGHGIGEYGGAALTGATIATGVGGIVRWGVMRFIAARGAGATAQNIANAPRLAQQLRAEQISSQFTAAGTLTPEAIANSQLIMQASRLGNPAIPAGFAKYTTAPLPLPLGGGSVTTRFYMNPATREVFYGLDYKTLFLP